MGVRPFTDTIAALRFGTLNDELAKQLNELTQACAATGRKGSLTLKLTLKPGTAGQIEISDEVSAKVPEHPKSSTLMFATPEGNLQREDPRQMPLGLRDVTPPATEPPREVAQA